MSERRREWNTSVVAVEVDADSGADGASSDTSLPIVMMVGAPAGGGGAFAGAETGQVFARWVGGDSLRAALPRRRFGRAAAGKWRSRIGAQINSRSEGLNSLEPLSPHDFFPSK